jgi:hypothetical protein
MHATIFGNVASIVARIYRRRQEYDMKAAAPRFSRSSNSKPEAKWFPAKFTYF